MISCTVCKNNGCCPLWKSEKIDIRLRCERGSSFDTNWQMVAIINHGEDLAENCKNFQKRI